MKKGLAFFLFFVLLFSFLPGCGPEPEPEPEPEPPVVVEPEPLDPRQTPKAIAFYNAEKEPWGEKDIHLYDFNGTIAATPLEKPTDELGLTSNVSLIHYPGTTTYRGMCIGDDALETLKRLNLPEGTIYIDKSQAFDGGYGFPVLFKPENLEEIVERHQNRLLIFRIYMDKDFNVITDVSCYIENYEQPSGIIENAEILIMFSFLNGQVDHYGASYIPEYQPMPEQPD